jgi:hypothetical protein
VVETKPETVADEPLPARQVDHRLLFPAPSAGLFPIVSWAAALSLVDDDLLQKLGVGNDRPWHLSDLSILSVSTSRLLALLLSLLF